MNTPEKPDYGEPWHYIGKTIWTQIGIEACDAHELQLKKRIIQCVNDCAGMVDPAKEIEAMREALQEAHTTLESIAKAKPSEWGEMSDQFKPWAQNRARHALAKLQPFINHDIRHTTH